MVIAIVGNEMEAFPIDFLWPRRRLLIILGLVWFCKGVAFVLFITPQELINMSDQAGLFSLSDKFEDGKGTYRTPRINLFQMGKLQRATA
jgi:hypothetical protein